jgi:hypothetical protein
MKSSHWFGAIAVDSGKKKAGWVGALFAWELGLRKFDDTVL